jgi:hypothetical protein
VPVITVRASHADVSFLLIPNVSVDGGARAPVVAITAGPH